ncbi:hypothetical protein Salat_2771400 [Sesamum alatum]|uniref:Uncharacterized protein n=1 Tax=Sesamum alatum TaxID=300844 RepID=A0AAE1XKI5_9LAMI|nr:hypothetical protein Salat_2771400 [Sesamum alatum]
MLRDCNEISGKNHIVRDDKIAAGGQALWPTEQLCDLTYPGWCGETTSLVVWVMVLQHHSMTWHLERMVKWVDDMGAWRESEGGSVDGQPANEGEGVCEEVFTTALGAAGAHADEGDGSLPDPRIY